MKKLGFGDKVLEVKHLLVELISSAWEGWGHIKTNQMVVDNYFKKNLSL